MIKYWKNIYRVSPVSAILFLVTFPVMLGVVGWSLVYVGHSLFTEEGRAQLHANQRAGCEQGAIEPQRCERLGIPMTWRVDG